MENLSGAISKEDVTENYRVIKERIAQAAEKAGRRPEEIELVAVTKTVPAVLINHSISLGVTHIGENRVQEMLSKLPDLRGDGLKISMIGHLQTNKAGLAVANSDMIQSVDSERLALEISRRAETLHKEMEILIEVNVGGEESKSGVLPGECDELVKKCGLLPGLRVSGLMTIPPISRDLAVTRRYFQKMHKLFVDICAKNSHNSNVNMRTLSMGMSDDYFDAILCGSNMVRIGSALYGKRVY